MRLKDILTDIIIVFSAVGLALYAIINGLGYMDAVRYVVMAAIGKV